MIRATIYLDTKPTNKKLITFDKNTTYEQLLQLCSKKLQSKIASLLNGSGEEINDLIIKESKELTLMCSTKKSKRENKIILSESQIIIKSYVNKSWIVKDATDQINALSKMQNIERIIIMPDVHSGKGHPIGVAVLTKKLIFPTLVDSDIGCGMQFIKLNTKELSAKKYEKYANKLFLDDLCENPDDILTKELLWPNKLEIVDSKRFNNLHKELGTIGGGNHFAELQQIEKIVNEKLCQEYQIDTKSLYLLVHSGSRQIGHTILHDFLDKVPNLEKGGLAIDSDFFKDYMDQHDYACHWAKRNRYLIAKKFLDQLNIDINNCQCILDIWHNTLVKKEDYYLHRKGVAPADQGPIVIPGSRGDYTYLVLPINANIESGWSLSHGAGRKLARTKSIETVKDRYPDVNVLKKTDLDSIVVCSDKQLLYAEAPQCYKKIDDVIQDLLDAKLIEIMAILKPVITYKINENH